MKLLNILIYINLFMTIPLFAGNDLSTFPTDDKYYTIQIKSFLAKEREKAEQFVDSLWVKNYLAYSTYKTIKGLGYLRVRIGIFKELSKAKEYAEKLKNKEGFDYFIDFADVFIDNYKDQFLIITTLNGIIYQDKNKFYELYNTGRRAKISPDGNFIVFSTVNKICKQNINTKVVSVLKQTNIEDELRSPRASWSPDSKYIAYLRYNGWEMHTELWLMNSDVSSDRCLIPYAKKRQYSVKNFLWHPEKNKIFYIFGPTFGTLTVGGNLFLTDLQGSVRPVIEVDLKKNEEIYREFRIVDGTIYYKVCRSDDQFIHRVFTLHKTYIKSIE